MWKQSKAAVVVLMLGVCPLFAQNLVSNGDFESGYSSGWNHLAGDGGVATYSEETTDPYEGSKALKVDVTTLGANAWSVQSLGPTMSMTVGEDYVLTFWGKADSAGTSAKTVVQNAIYSGKTHSLGTSWAEYTWNFTAAETDPSIRLQYPALGTIWMDDIRIEAVNTNPPAATTNAVTVTLSPATRHQAMVGFGGALTWYSAWLYYGTNAPTVNQLMFEDLGLDVLRLKNWYYPSNYPAATDPSDLGASFNSASNYYYAAKGFNPQIEVLLSSWSPPESLKSNGERPNGGTLTKDSSNNYHYAELAQYWVDCLDNLGWTPDYLSFQNEPGWVATWESCIFDPTETGTYAGYAEASDVIWDAIKDRPNVPKLVGSEAENMNAFFNLNTPLLSRPYIAAHAYHNYNIGNDSQIDSSISLLNNIRDSYGDRPNWMTEYSKSEFDWIQAARVVHNTVVEANASTYIYWSMIWEDVSPGYMIGLTSSNWNSYTVGPHYYTIKHYAKHVDKGYQRFETVSDHGDVKVSGFVSPGGTNVTLVMINRSAIETAEVTLSHTLLVGAAEGYQSVSNNYYQTMASLDIGQPVALPPYSMTTLSLSLSDPLPATSDLDDDGLPDDWEATNFGDASSSDGTGDNDNDGFNDLNEYLAGTSPTNGESLLAVTDGRSGSSPDEFVISWLAVTNKTYMILNSDNLIGAPWTTNQFDIPGVEPLCVRTVTVSNAKGYYQVRLQD